MLNQLFSREAREDLSERSGVTGDLLWTTDFTILHHDGDGGLTVERSKFLTVSYPALTGSYPASQCRARP